MDIKTSFISYICNQITNIEVKMVLEIRLSNMFSFRDEVTLDLQAAKIQTKKARELEGNLFSVDGEQMLKSVALLVCLIIATMRSSSTPLITPIC